MSFKKHITDTIRLAVPISLGQLGHIMMGVVDSIMVGNVNYESLAAASLVNGLFFLILVLGLGMSMASTPLIAMDHGSERFNECGVTLNHSVLVNVVFSFVLMAILFIVSFIIPYLNQPKEVTELSIPYLQVLILSIIPFILFQSYRQYLEGLSLPNAPMVIAIAANLFNAFLNWIFIFGNLGVEPMGLFGAGIATTITRWAMAIILIAYVIRSKRIAKYNPKLNFKPINISLIKKLVHIGLPSGFQYFLEVGCFSFATIMVGWLGSKQQAAHQIALNMASVTYMIMLGISAAGTVRVGYAAGKKNQSEIRYAGFSAIGIAAVLMFVFAILFFLFREFLPTIYNKNDIVLKYASNLLIIAGFFQLFDGLQATAIGVLRGLTDVKIPLVFSLFSYWVLAIPVAALLTFYFNADVYGVWIGLLVGLSSLGIILLIRFNTQSKRAVI